MHSSLTIWNRLHIIYLTDAISTATYFLIMTMYSEDYVFWISKVTALGVRLNKDEWTMADKLLAPMQLFAWQQKRDSTPRDEDSTPSDEDRADVYIPIDNDELQRYIPSPPSWKLPCINFKSNQSYKLHLNEFRQAYVRQWEICNRCPDTNQMATWETILRYWRQAAHFFLRFWAMHHDLEKLDAVDAAIKVIREHFFQHNDLERYCNNLLHDFKKMGIAKPGSHKKRARTYTGSDSGSDESSKDSKPIPPSTPGSRTKRARTGIVSDGSSDEGSSECANAMPPEIAASVEADEVENNEGDEIATTESDYNSTSDSNYNPLEDNDSLPSAESEMKNAAIYDLDDDSAINSKDYEGEKQLQERGVVSISFSAMVDTANKNESEPNDSESSDGDESECLQQSQQLDETGFQQASFESVAGSEHYCVEMYTLGEGATNPPAEPDLAFKLEKGDLYSNIRHFVDHLVLHGLTPPGMSDPTLSSVKSTMKACGMHVKEREGSSDEDYMNSYTRWVPALHLDNFLKYMSSFHEICCNDTMTSGRLARKGRYQTLAIARDQMDERIQEYFKNYAPPSAKGPNLEDITSMISGSN